MNFSEKYLMLRNVEPFKSIDPDDAAAIALVCEYHRFRPGSLICAEKALPTHLFIAFRGSVNYCGKKTKIFDVPSLLNLSEFECGAYADDIEGADCLVISREHFIGIIRNCPEILTGLCALKKDGRAS